MRREHRSQTAGEEERKLVGFVIGPVHYGIDIMEVSEVISPLTLYPLPRAPGHIVGVAHHRKEVVPIIDLQVRFQLAGARSLERKKWIIVKTHGKSAGLLVDRPTSVIKVSRSNRAQELLRQTSGIEDWIKDVYEVDDDLIFEIDIDAAIGPAADYVASVQAGSGELHE